jgi:hypothetical protein
LVDPDHQRRPVGSVSTHLDVPDPTNIHRTDFHRFGDYLCNGPIDVESVLGIQLGEVGFDGCVGAVCQECLSELAAEAFPISQDFAVGWVELRERHRNPDRGC